MSETPWLVVSTTNAKKLSDNVCNENRDVTDVSHGVEHVPMRHISDETALSNSVIASNEQSGQQDIDQCVSDSDYLGLNPSPSVCGHKGLSHSFHTNGHDGLNQVSHKNAKGLNTNTLNENQDRVNTDCSDHCEHNHVKLIYDTKYCGFEDKFTSYILHANQKGSKGEWEVIDESIHQLWHSQVDFKFGYVPLQKQVLPSSDLCTNDFSGSLLQIHNIVKKSGKPNSL